jgi:thioredoxin-dependent peroxiredoxin
MQISVLNFAPQFSLPDEQGNLKTLDDFRGKWLVLYFYPKDDTPGCSVQACSLRDIRDELMDMGAQIIGVSKDSVDSHESFKAKYSLNFTLLSDETGKTIEDYGAWGKNMLGIEGIMRKTFLIDPEGKIHKIYSQVIPVGHGKKVISDLKGLLK